MYRYAQPQRDHPAIRDGMLRPPPHSRVTLDLKILYIYLSVCTYRATRDATMIIFQLRIVWRQKKRNQIHRTERGNKNYFSTLFFPVNCFSGPDR